MESRIAFSYFFVVIFAVACGNPLRPVPHSEKRQNTETVRRVVRLEYAASLQPYLDDKGLLNIPGQKLERWSGRTFVGSSAYDLVPVD